MTDETTNIKDLKVRIVKAGRIPTSREEFETFSPLYYLMSYEEFLSEPLYHRLTEVKRRDGD